jgi:hypothetical protein
VPLFVEYADLTTALTKRASGPEGRVGDLITLL